MYTKRKFLKEYGQIIHAKHAKIKVPITWYSIIVTVLFLGRFPIAPGTLGSIAAYPLFYAAITSVASIAEVQNILLFLTIFLGILGIIAISVFQNKTNTHDHKCVVIDELVGQLLTLYIALPNAKVLAMAFKSLFNLATYNLIFIICLLAFRFFDIVKPFFISSIDRQFKNSVGVMIDDIAAALLAGGSIYLLGNILSYIN